MKGKMARLSCPGSHLTKQLDFPSHWRVVGVEYDLEQDRCVLLVKGSPPVNEQAEIDVTVTKGAIVYTTAGRFLGAREASKQQLRGLT